MESNPGKGLMNTVEKKRFILLHKLGNKAIAKFERTDFNFERNSVVVVEQHIQRVNQGVGVVAQQ